MTHANGLKTFGFLYLQNETEILKLFLFSYQISAVERMYILFTYFDRQQHICIFQH